MKPPSEFWVRKHIKSDPAFHHAKAITISPAKVNATHPENISNWFEQMMAEIDPNSYEPSLIFNMDETMLEPTARREKSFAPVGQKAIRHSKDNAGLKHTTLLFCISAEGGFLKPAVVLPLKRFPKGCEDLESDFHWLYGKAGWITKDSLYKWTIESFIPHVERVKREKNLLGKRALLFADSHSSRGSIRFLTALRGAQIDIYTIPSHTSHVLQPLDCGVNGSFKNKLRKKKSSMTGGSLPQVRRETLEWTAEAYKEALCERTIQNAWATSGLYPVNVEVALVSKYVPSGDSPLHSPSTSKRRRNHFPLDGKHLNSVDNINELKKRRRN